MNWTLSADLRAQVQRKWDRGDLLRATVSDAIAWPLKLTLRAPSPAELAHHFEAVRDWVAGLSNTPHVRVEWEEWNHRIQGKQKIPAEAWVDTLQNALALIGRDLQSQRFAEAWRDTVVRQPMLLPWMLKHPLKALELADRWSRLLAVVEWLQAHPRPSVYLRQVDAPGVDSKFIEAHRGVLSELFELALTPEMIDTQAAGSSQFARRYGFLEKPIRVRFRLLDSTLTSLPGCEGRPDVTLDATSFSKLSLPVEHVFITENETNFLAFPSFSAAIVIFGAGYGWDALARAAWLQTVNLSYWGDIDTHGFAILDQLRGYFPNMVSFLMDRETLLAHRSHWGEEPQPVRHDLPRLTIEEATVYDSLRFDRLQSKLRLEQERVSYVWLSERLKDSASRQVRVPVCPQA